MAAVVHANSHRRELRFPPNTPLRTIRAAIDETRSQLRKLPNAERHTFAADATRYLQRVQNTLSSFKDRERHLNAWLPMFGHVRTLSLSQHVAAINDHLHRWRNELSASSCNQRRDALTNCVKVLYGRRAALELADIIRFQQPPPSDEWVPRKVITSVLMHLTPGTKTEARLTLMHWSGMRPSQMGRMTRENFHLNERLPFLVGSAGKTRTSLHRPPGTRRPRGSTVILRNQRLRTMEQRQRQQGARSGRPQGRSRTLHRLRHPTLVRHNPAPHRNGRRRHPDDLRTHEREDDGDLRAQEHDKARGSHRAA